MIDLEQYKVFVIVADEKNITRASEKLHISQPAVSKHIKNLENNLQIKLFNRTNYGIELTIEGNKIYNEIKEHIYALEKIYDKYKKIREINLGIHANMLNKLFSQSISTYYTFNENVKINTINNDLNEMLSKLEKQELDLVITKKALDYNNDLIEFIKLGELHDILISAPDSELQNTVITIDNLKDKIIYLPRKTSTTTYNFYNSLNLSENDFKTIRNISYSTMLEIIKNTNGIGVITKEYFQTEIDEKHIIKLKTDFKLKPIPYGIYINKNNHFKELKELIKILSEKL